MSGFVARKKVLRTAGLGDTARDVSRVLRLCFKHWQSLSRSMTEETIAIGQ
jgi:hypothetical protein